MNNDFDVNKALDALVAGYKVEIKISEDGSGIAETIEGKAKKAEDGDDCFVEDQSIHYVRSR